MTLDIPLGKMGTSQTHLFQNALFYLPRSTTIKNNKMALHNNGVDKIDDDDSDDGNESLDSCDVPRDTANKTNETERDTLARRENTVVACMKGAVLLVLLLTAFWVSFGMLAFAQDNQNQKFEEAFAADAVKLIESFHKTIARQLEAIDTLSVSITSHARAKGEKFPNVTVPDFGVRFADTRVSTGSFMVSYHPLVTDETRKGWEQYQVENSDHFYKELEVETLLRERQDALYGISSVRPEDLPTYPPGTDEAAITWPETNTEISRMTPVGGLAVAENGTGPYLPMWHMSPVPFNKVTMNFDTISHPAFGGSQLKTVESGQAVLDVAIRISAGDLGGTGEFYSMLLALSQYRQNVDEYAGDPTSAFSYPVFDSFDLDNRTVAGIVGTNIYWRLFFTNILPPNTRGIVCVLENTRNQSYTFGIGNSVTFLGVGDLHERKYTHMRKSSDDESNDLASSLLYRSFTSVDLNTDYCKYKISVYPTDELASIYRNNEPVRVMLVILSVFLFTSLVFILYTVAVARRQKIVMNRAVASSAIVSSLFPSQVRDQIYEENDTEKKKNWSKDDGNDAFDQTLASVALSRPIAEVFEDTTIMFADMVGFTKWSSKRQPVQVFELLETLYQAFDGIAVRRKVFKVETIGDCYVAVAGLPEPQENHAVIMTKFADDCMVKMRQLTTELADVLGEDTASLAMRVGLHSGSVTGGVLRGQKSRFQLFGDTMNTASRMESNGMPNRIHVSEETAEELSAKGKACWLTPREDKIVAKGKGEMQTYWVSLRQESRSARSSLPQQELEAFSKEIATGEPTVGGSIEI